MATALTPVAVICARCASRDVSRDAWADWDAAEQRRTLRTAFDYAYCHSCDGETSLTEVALRR